MEQQPGRAAPLTADEAGDHVEAEAYQAAHAEADGGAPLVPAPAGPPTSPAAFDAAIAAVFAADGPLARTKAGFEPRPGQMLLARAIGAALTEQRPLLAEAGTGTGKTLAYLVPALLSRLKVVVSTATKQLQEQVLDQDVPALEVALGRPIDAVGMKGRQNFLCEARAEDVLHRLAQEPGRAQLAGQLADWRATTPTGERSDFLFLGESDPLWRELTATREQCTGRACRQYERCWVVRMRRRAQEAELVVVNHHLFFADAAMSGGGSLEGGGGGGGAAGLLPSFEAAVFDEAHELDEVAAQHFGQQVSERQLLELLAEVARRQHEAVHLPDFTPVLARAASEVRALFATLGASGRAPLLSGPPEVLDARDRHRARIDDALAYLEAELLAHSDEASRQLGVRLGRAARTLSFVLDKAPRAGLLHGDDELFAQPEAPGVAGRAAALAGAGSGTAPGAQTGDDGWTDGRTIVLDSPSASSAGSNRSVREKNGEEDGDGLGGTGRARPDDEPVYVLDEPAGPAEGQAQAHALEAAGGVPAAGGPAGAAVPRDAFVRFGDVQGSHRSLAARPLDVAERMASVFADTPCVFVSATLQVGGDFGHSTRRLGLPNVETLMLPSAFDFSKQAALYLPRDLPSPEGDPQGARAAARAAELCAASGGGAMVLCTSHRGLQGMARALRGATPGPLLVQGEAPRPHLLRTFAARTDAVLVATLGFWQGVDVPGPALRLVVMDRIPFAVPTDPVVQARAVALAESGLDPFVHHALPQAALLLRQGFGRLIRTQTDLGVVAMLDARLHARSYGLRLLEALPLCPHVHELDDVLARLRANRPDA